MSVPEYPFLIILIHFCSSWVIYGATIKTKTSKKPKQNTWKLPCHGFSSVFFGGLRPSQFGTSPLRGVASLHLGAFQWPRATDLGAELGSFGEFGSRLDRNDSGTSLGTVFVVALWGLSEFFVSFWRFGDICSLVLNNIQQLYNLRRFSSQLLPNIRSICAFKGSFRSSALPQKTPRSFVPPTTSRWVCCRPSWISPGTWRCQRRRQWKDTGLWRKTTEWWGVEEFWVGVESLWNLYKTSWKRLLVLLDDCALGWKHQSSFNFACFQSCLDIT